MARSFLLLLVAAVAVSACDSDPVDSGVQSATVTDLAADPAVRSVIDGSLQQTGRYTLFSLRENRVVLAYDNANRADSASTAWDIGFQGSTIIFNGGTSGPGRAQGVIVAEAFADVTEVPAGTVFRTDGSAQCPSGPALAVCSGSGNGWYTYVPFQSSNGGYLVPTPGRTLLVRTADGQGSAKIQIKSYYQGNPAPSTITLQTPARYFSFDFAVNLDGTTFVDAQ